MVVGMSVVRDGGGCSPLHGGALEDAGRAVRVPVVLTSVACTEPDSYYLPVLLCHVYERRQDRWGTWYQYTRLEERSCR